MNTTDKELLEMAAKVAGYKVDGNWGFDDGWGLRVFNEEDTRAYWWNPLEDDGDTFRLAVKLQLEIDICSTYISVFTPNGTKVLMAADEEENQYTATRRAIVLAAAEIGKNLD